MRTLLRPLRPAALLALAAFSQVAGAAQGAANWAEVEKEARGQTVYFNAWAGDATINRYVAWASDEVRRRHGVQLVLVKVADIAEAVTRIQAEKAAGRTTGGSVDLMWINGENFASLKAAGLLHGPWVEALPNARWLDPTDPTQATDFTVPTAGLEMPWGGARFTFFYESAAIRSAPPRTPGDLLAWVRAHPGRFTYPRPPDFIGTSFLKQLLLLLAADPARLQRPVASDFDAVTQPLWTWLDAAHPHLWRSGRAFPRSSPEQRRLLGDGEVDWLLSFNPLEAARAIRARELSPSIKGVHFAQGALGNSHFLAIPFNSSAKAGARVVANFLLSPEAQARKADPAYWGDPTVLSLASLGAADRARFARGGPETAAPEAVPLLPEPHPSWTPALERAWSLRYGTR